MLRVSSCRALWLASLSLVAACGGGGGGDGAPVATPARLETGDVEFAPTATTADLIVSLTDLPSPAPVLLQLAIELPPALATAQDNPLLPLQNVPTLRGARDGARFLIVCGDDQDRAGAPLRNGELFRLRLVTTTPRQVGSHAITLRDLLVAQSDGTAATVDSNPMTVSAIVR